MHICPTQFPRTTSNGIILLFFSYRLSYTFFTCRWQSASLCGGSWVLPAWRAATNKIRMMDPGNRWGLGDAGECTRLCQNGSLQLPFQGPTWMEQCDHISSDDRIFIDKYQCDGCRYWTKCPCKFLLFAKNVQCNIILHTQTHTWACTSSHIQLRINEKQRQLHGSMLKLLAPQHSQAEGHLVD